MSSSSIMTSASDKTTPPASQPSSIRSVELPTRSPKLKPQNGQPVANGLLNADGQPKQTEKASVKDRLTRMFSSKGDLPKATTTSEPVPVSQTNSTASTTAAARTPPQPVRKPSTNNKPAEGAVSTTSKTTQSQRYIVNANVQGGHEHHLKGSKRQEKLSDMWKSLLGRKHEQAPEADLSLVSNWVDTLKQEKDSLAGDRKGGPNATTTLIEKYGKCQEVVGRGAFGIVRISHKKVENGEKLFAVKEFRRRPEETEKKYSKRLTAEFCISSSLRHPNVIHTLDLLKDSKGDYCEVMEFCSGGDLYTLVLAAGKLEVQEADCYFKQMMRGVEYMHEMGVAHRDMKPENLLLTSHGALKITDFGNGECFRMAWENDAHMVSGLCGSAPYIAPEEYIDREFDARAVDVWACGVIYMAMRTGRHLWRVAKKDEDEFYERYLEGRRDEEGYGPIESLHRARCRNVIYSILDPNPSRRITASQVLKSEWGREIKLCKAGEEGL
ncbi:serine threonine-protein kinase hal4 [Seiridium cupressi]|uniref:non-specific serine/threonine protein kinase n=1 Tax=Seiridium unicorne TaxID=138068 RepID=A0ABR2VFX7_9PEZI